MITYDIVCEDCPQVLGTVELPDDQDPAEALGGYVCVPCAEARRQVPSQPEEE